MRPTARFLIVFSLVALLALPVGGQDPPAERPEAPEVPEAQDSPETQEAQEAEAPPTPTDRITFVLPLPEDQGGGEIHGDAGALEYRSEDLAVLTGGVEIRYQDVTIRAGEIEVDLTTQALVARGNVVIDHGPDRMTAGEANLDLETKTGTLSDATIAVADGYHFSGDEVTRESEHVYTMSAGTFTSCEGEVPPWSFHVKRARVEEDAYARLYHTSMRVKRMPVLYTPYILWPTKTDRSSGILVPKIGNSNERGFYLGLAYYQVLGRSYDTTFYVDLWSKEYYGIGNEFRYRPSEHNEGRFDGYIIRDPVTESNRWKLRLDHEASDLPFGFRGVVHIEDFSDFQWFQDFERDINATARNWVYSMAFLSGNWGNHSANILVDRRQNFTTSSGRVVELQQLPEIEYELRPTRLGRTPLYLTFDGSAHYFSVDRSETYEGSYGRLDLAPRVKWPLSNWPWLSASVTAGYRFTWYGDSLDNSGPTSFRGESLTRSVPTATVEVVGPSISQIFDGGRKKLKHIVEPRFDYTYQQAFDEQSEVPIFDEADRIAGRNVGRFALVNRLLAKPGGEDGGSAREVLSFELFRFYSFDDTVFLERGADEMSRWGPLQATVRSYPSDSFGLRFDAGYSLLFNQVTNIRLTGEVGGRRNRVAFSWAPTWRAVTGETLANQASVRIDWQMLPGRVHLSSAVSYDFERSLLRDQRHFLTWLGSCFTIKVELHELRTVSQNRREYLFSVDLKNVGTFFDLTGVDTGTY